MIFKGLQIKEGTVDLFFLKCRRSRDRHRQACAACMVQCTDSIPKQAASTWLYQ